MGKGNDPRRKRALADQLQGVRKSRSRDDAVAKHCWDSRWPARAQGQTRHLLATFGDYWMRREVPGRPPALSRRFKVRGRRHGAGVKQMQPVEFLFLSDGRLFIRDATGEIVEAEASARGHAASLMLVLDEIATVDPTRGLELVPPADS